MNFRLRVSGFSISGLSLRGYLCGVVMIVIGVSSLLWLLMYILHAAGGSSDTNRLVIERSLHASDEYSYGIVIDGGSSGSRIFIYKWPPHSGKENELLQIEPALDAKGRHLVMKISPGLSSFSKNPSAAGIYLKPLLEFAESHIPHQKHRETPLYILTTAGMRLLLESEQTAILESVRRTIPTVCDFNFHENHARVITGKEEGAYSWIAINYVLNRLNAGINASGSLTAGIIDMGGASTQIAFEVGSSNSLPQHLTSEYDLGCSDSDTTHRYRIYVTTFLGYGANAARDRYEAMLKQKQQQQNNGTTAIDDPCMSAEFKESRPDGLNLLGSGDLDRCMKQIRVLLNTSVMCSLPPCSMNGVHQPSVDVDRQEFYGFSEFWYSMEDTLNMGGHYSYAKYYSEVSKWCSIKWSLVESNSKNGRYPKADEHRVKYQCFKSAWVMVVLHDGLKFPNNYAHFTSAQSLKQQEVQWTLGALLHLSRFIPLKYIQTVTNNIRHYHASEGLQIPHVLAVLVILLVIYILLFRVRPSLLRKLRRVPTVTTFRADVEAPEDSPQMPMIRYF